MQQLAALEQEEKELSNVSNEDFADLGSSSESSNDEREDDSSDNDSDVSNEGDNKRKKKKTIKKSPKKPKKAPKPRIIFNVSDTQYDVVKYVGKKVFNWKLSYDDKESMEWDLLWTDWAVQPETLAKMQTYQKINHFPGMYSLARKNHLGRNLMRMKKTFPKNYKFFPQTFLLPSEYNEFRSQFTKNSTKTFIVKPEASCQGKGIFLTQTLDQVQMGEHYVVQRYMQKPYLIDGLKFDMRIYVLIAGCDPLKVFLYDDGLGRFATEPYVAPTPENLDNVCMHLTNYAINKDNPNFVFNESSNADDVGHKRSLKAVMKLLREQGHDVDKLWKEIKKIIIKTFCSVQPILAHSYRSCHPDEPYNNMCFELLGFDIMLDHKLKPWLIEVNHTPSFTTDTPLDKSIKKSAIRDALKIMNISLENTTKAKNKKRAELQQRVLTGKKVKLTAEEKKEGIENAQKERDEWESKNCGRYEKIYPFDDPAECEEDYEEFMKVANKWFEEWTGISIKRNTKKVADPNKPLPMVFGSGKAKEVQKPVKSVIQKAVENKAEKMEEQELFGPENLDEENKDFMAHVAAITGKEGCDVVPEDHEDGVERLMSTNKAHKSNTLALSGIQKTEGQDNEEDGHGSRASSMNVLGMSPDGKANPRAFRIKNVSTSKKNSNAERIEEFPGAGASPHGRFEREIHMKKVPLKLSNGIVGDFNSVGLNPMWTGADEMYNQEFERDPRDQRDLRDLRDLRGANLLLNKASGRNEYNVRGFGKKGASPFVQNQKQQQRNYIAPKLLELNLNTSTKDDSQSKGSGLSLQGFGVGSKVSGRGLYQKPSNQSVGPSHDAQAAMQRYYNVLNQGKR